MKHLLDEKYITTGQAAKLGNVTPVTVRKWCEKFKLGKVIGGCWHVDEGLWKEFIGKTRNFIQTPEARKIAGVTKMTIIKWCKDFGIGEKIGGNWRIDKDKLKKILKGDINYGKD
jgi:hypothetical protein